MVLCRIFNYILTVAHCPTQPRQTLGFWPWPIIISFEVRYIFGIIWFGSCYLHVSSGSEWIRAVEKVHHVFVLKLCQQWLCLGVTGLASVSLQWMAALLQNGEPWAVWLIRNTRSALDAPWTLSQFLSPSFLPSCDSPLASAEYSSPGRPTCLRGVASVKINYTNVKTTVYVHVVMWPSTGSLGFLFRDSHPSGPQM